MELREVMARLAASSGFRASFEETATRALLAEPQVVAGTLIVAVPGQFLRATQNPEGHWLWLSGDRLWMAEGDAPEVEADADTRRFFQEFEQFFRGDLVALEAKYELEFRAMGAVSGTGSDQQGWELILTPRSVQVRAALDRIVLTGASEEQSTWIERVDLREASGDQVRLELGPPDVQRAWTAEELEAIFRARELP